MEHPQKSVILGYEFECPLTSDEMENVGDAIAEGSGIYAAFSPSGSHLFVLADLPVNTQPNGEIMGVEVDLAVPGIHKARPELRRYTDSTDRGNGWKKIYDATHQVGCACHSCEGE